MIDLLFALFSLPPAAGTKKQFPAAPLLQYHHHQQRCFIVYKYCRQRGYAYSTRDPSGFDSQIDKYLI
jgi:hypothetical protein